MSQVKVSGNASGTGIIEIAAPNTSTNRTLTLPDNTGTLISTGSTFAGTGPAFSAYRTTGTSVTTATYTKIVFNVSEYDTASCYSTSTGRFTPTVAGYYALSSSVGCQAGSERALSFYKNGAEYRGTGDMNVAFTVNGSCMVYLNGSTDYVEVYFYQASGSTQSTYAAASAVWFQGCMVRSA